MCRSPDFAEQFLKASCVANTFTFTMSWPMPLFVALASLGQQSTMVSALMKPVNFTVCHIQSLLGKAGVHVIMDAWLQQPR